MRTRKAFVADINHPDSPSQKPQSLNDSLGEPSLPTSWQRIIKSTFSLNVDVAWDEVMLAKELLGSGSLGLMPYADLIDHLTKTVEAHENLIQLAINAELNVRRYLSDVETLQAPMRDRARAALQAEKPDKGGKAITDGDVKSRMVGLFPDEMRRQSQMIAEANGALEFLQRLRDSFASRRREIESVIRTSRQQ